MYMFSSIGFSELLIILVIALVLFGGRKIPQLARDLGSGIKEFRRSLLDTSLDSNDDAYKNEQRFKTSSRLSNSKTNTREKLVAQRRRKTKGS